MSNIPDSKLCDMVLIFFKMGGVFCSAFAALHMCLFLHYFLTCFARDNITTLSGLISDFNDDTLVSAGAKFELGFFNPSFDRGAAGRRRYVAIWYYNSSSRAVVWVANRDSPLNDFTGVLAIRDGNIQVLDGEGKSYWSSELNESAFARTAKLLDNGNFVLVDDISGETLWESFKNPTDTFLPGMEMNEDLTLISWNSRDDPSKGNFTFQKYQQDRYIVRKRTVPYWVSGKSEMYISYNIIPDSIVWMLSNVTRTGSTGRVYNVSAPVLFKYNHARLVMTVSGTIELVDIENHNLWSAPQDKCSIDNACGNFGSCNVENELLCRCLPGFSPGSPDNWDSGDFSDGCVRKPSCDKNVTFLSLKMMKIKSLETVDARKGKSESDCKNDCLQDCKCLAYSYAAMDIKKSDTKNDPMCWIWRQELSDLQEQYPNVNSTLNVRVAVSDLGSTSRNCKPCGTNLVPYPLCTGDECGDPSYRFFSCNNSTGQLSFRAKSTTFPVLSINTTTASFIIQVVDGTKKHCGARARDNNLQLENSSPFHVINFCYVQPGKFIMSRGRDFVEIGWDPPLQPLCTQLSDCQEWQNSSCLSSQDGKKRCLCNRNFRWDSVAINCIQVGGNGTGFPTLAPREGQTHRKRRVASLVIYATVTAIVIAVGLSCSVVFFICKRKTMVVRLQDDERSQSLTLYDSETRAVRMIQSAQFSEDDKRSIEVPFFELDSIIAATNNFSDENKLGRGGFGPVYKGVFPGNRQIAIKLLASVSGQGLDEFKNEIVLISRLQHRNLVRLVGYCVTKEEKMLLYEYMPNKSLDYFIFDRALSMHLNWDIRFSIIMGVARGLLYLHEDSRLKIIHRDLKLSNILLDEELNPKISDFGLARIFRSKQTEAITSKIVGTYGYMSPEYALEGFFSVKSDVFSLGVMILEIISGRRNTGFYNSDQALSLLGFAWKLWTEGLAMDLMDRELLECFKKDEYMKCMQIGLLCVQEDPKDRPTMSSLVRMLGSEIASLPTPKQPAFVLARGIQSGTGSSSNNQKSNSSNKLTLSAFEGR